MANVPVARFSTPFVIGTNAKGGNRVSVSLVGGADAGEFVVVWSVDSDVLGLGDGSTSAIYGQMYNQDGSTQVATFLINSTTSSEQVEPLVISRNSTEGFAVAFRDFSRIGTGFGTDPRLRLFDGSGAASGPDVVVNAGGPTETGIVSQVSIARGEAFGAYFVTWTDYASAPNGDGMDIRGRLFGDAGPLAADFRITTTATPGGETGFQAQSNVASLPQTGFVVTWTDNVDSGGEVFGGGTKIRGQLYSFLGVAIGSQFDIASTTNKLNEPVSFPVSAGFGGLGGNQFVTAWTEDDDATAGIDFNIHYRMFSISGTTAVGGADMILSQTTAGNQSQVFLAAYDVDRFVAVWTQQVPFQAPSVRGRMFDQSGNALSDEFIVIPEGVFTGSLATVTILDDTILAHPIPRFVVTWRDDAGVAWGQIYSPTASELLNIDWFGSDRPETYTAQYNEHVLAGNGGNDVLTGSALADQLSGNAGFDTLSGLGGDDTLDGGVNTDTTNGGDGNDTHVVDSALDVVVEAATAGSGVDTVSSFTISLNLASYTNIERLALTGALALNLTGNGLANTLTGNSGANVIIGGAGIDAMIGLDGNDTFDVDVAGDTVTETASGGTDTVRSSTISLNLASFANVENVTLLGALALSATGNAGANGLTGSSNTAANVLTGLGGNDSYTVGAGDTVVEAAGGGTDTVLSSTLSLNLASFANVENATLLGSAALSAIGNSGANGLTGSSNTAANVLTGLAGADVYTVGTGDTIVEAAGGGTDVVISNLISLSLANYANVENVTLTGALALNATGDANANALDGAASSGSNVLTGLGGNDVYFVGAGDTIVEAAAGGTDTANSATVSIDLGLAAFANVENAQLNGALALSATGNANANTLFGSTSTGANVLTGLSGNDTFYVGAGDTVVEAAGGGTDTVASNLISLNLASFANVENATLTSVLALSATGNANANGLSGASNTAANVLTGLGGSDVYTVGAGDTIVEAAGGGADTVISNLISLNLANYANVENVWLNGSTAGLNATGNASANNVYGNAASNTLTGLGGADGFYFNTALGASNIDTITDFSALDDTVFLENAVFTTLATGTLAASAFRIGSAALDADDRIIYNSATGALLYDPDGTGAAAAQQFATLTAGLALTSADFTVI